MSDNRRQHYHRDNHNQHQRWESPRGDRPPSRPRRGQWGNHFNPNDGRYNDGPPLHDPPRVSSEGLLPGRWEAPSHSSSGREDSSRGRHHDDRPPRSGLESLPPGRWEHPPNHSSSANHPLDGSSDTRASGRQPESDRNNAHELRSQPERALSEHDRSDEARRNDSIDFTVLFVAIDNPVPTSNWTVSKSQPLEMALMAKADLETVKTRYELYPEALTEQLFANVLKCGAKPGVVGFLAKQRPALIDERALELAVAQGPGPDRPTESEIIALAEINPELLVPKGPDYEIPACLCSVLSWKYSQEFSKNMFGVMAGKTTVSQVVLPYDLTLARRLPSARDNSSTKRNALDLTAVAGMAPMLDGKALKSVEIPGENWELNAFLEVVRRIVSNKSIQTVVLGFPELSHDQLGDSLCFNTETWKRMLSQWKPVFLVLNFARCPNSPLAVSFLEQCLKSMPRLEGLDLGFDTDVDAAVPTICRCLRDDASITILSLVVRSDTTAKGLDPILKALDTCRISGFGCAIEENHPDKCKGYHEILLNILQNNTRLEYVDFRDCLTDDNPNGDNCLKVGPSQDLLPFYTALNACGREYARSQEAVNAHFLDLLEMVQMSELCLHADPVPAGPQDAELMFGQSVRKRPATEEDRFNILYGLLRENPAKWSQSPNTSQRASRKSARCGSKRKHSALS
ncbi:expressed unknown protein [Seminavis robusta]|uniref:Uncharacterized protein n=1 Tax=Seminavis robusta TaxID=568900 RepID=A0A9N8HZ12_9STRA|nr:expressed unknown protein [Seminavis robusta]|eukprot:Sro2143_g316231.1  (685) ;mRNA; r:6850-8904